MKKNYYLLATFVLSAALNAEIQVSGKLTHESAAYTNDGLNVGQSTTHENRAMKSETSARIYLDGSVGDSEDTFHLELQGYSNEAGDMSQGSKSFTQREVLREAYIDTSAKDWAIRAGKQQVVWGKADGYKALDLINPTDYSEMAQNQMEDSRIPTFMINAEKYNADGSSTQIVLSQPRENIFAGLNRSTTTGFYTNPLFATDSYTSGTWNSTSNFSMWSNDTASTNQDDNHPFMLKGVDAIVGKRNGFLNVVPDLGSVAALFGRAFAMNGASDTNYDSSGFTAAADDHQAGLAPTSHGGSAAGFTVGNFNLGNALGLYSTSFIAATAANTDPNGDDTAGDGSGYGFEETNLGTSAFWLAKAADYSSLANVGDDYANDGAGAVFTGAATLAAFAAKFGTNLNDRSTSEIDSVFEYMDRTSFTTFDAFVNAKSEFVQDMPSDLDANLAFRYNNTTKDGLNYSAIYSYNYDTNPVLKMTWRDKNGNEVQTVRNGVFPTIGTGNVSTADDKVYTTFLTISGIGGGASETAGSDTNLATLRITETMERAHNIGGAVDYALETEKFGPIVLRAEGLYQKDVYSPIVDRGALSIGDLTKAMYMQKGDKLRYALGADFTVDTDMMVSGQFIQERNLDYVDKNIDWDGSACDTTRTGYYNDAKYAENCGVYTADFASMSMSNGFKKAKKNKEFYSLYLSKPFGASKEHRWNNIFMYEEDGGKWNRLDAEYSIDDNTQLTAEYNKYWGNEDTQFGQLAKASNVQLGVKVSF